MGVGKSRGGVERERTDYLKEEKICFSGISLVSVSEQLCFLYFLLTFDINH